MFYTGANSLKNGVTQDKNTWWGQVIEFFGGRLLVNNSWSGSRVTKVPGNDGLFPSGCSDERTSGLHTLDGRYHTFNATASLQSSLGMFDEKPELPDVIIIYMGINDWANAVPLDTDCTHMIVPGAYPDTFEDAYKSMVYKIRSHYPEAEIWCCTLNETCISTSKVFRFPHAYAGVHIEDYNRAIRRTAEESGCRLVDIYQQHIPYDTLDGTHPNRAGMETIAALICHETADCDSNIWQEYFKNIEKAVQEKSGIKQIIIEKMNCNTGKWIQYDIVSGELKYRNVISPTLGGERFPDGYFDAKTIKLNEEQRDLCNDILKQYQGVFEFHEMPYVSLPPGAHFDMFIKYTDETDTEYYCTDEKEKKSVKEQFSALFHEFENFCVNCGAPIGF